MTTLPAPAAARLRRPSWRDTRLLVGVALVLLATALGAYGLRAADSRMTMYAARDALVPGQRLTPENLVRVEVQLSDLASDYLSVDGGLPSDGFVLRDVRAGELVPSASVGTGSQVDVSPLAIAVDQASAGALVIGSTVDVYANTPVETDGKDGWSGPQRMLERVSVARLSSGGGLGGGSGRSAVQVLVPGDDVGSVISLIDSGAKFTLVPVPGSALREAS